MDYEPDLRGHIDDLAKSESVPKINSLIQTGLIHSVHIDIMRPPMIPHETKFSLELLERVYVWFHLETRLAFHLMVGDPSPIINEISRFVYAKERTETTVIIQVESYESEEETIKSLRLLKNYGFHKGISLNLPTARDKLNERIVENADMVLLMTVPMGSGGQKYNDLSTQRIRYFSQIFPSKLIEVDGGIDPQTISTAMKAGARMVVVGSFITRSNDPLRALGEIRKSLRPRS